MSELTKEQLEQDSKPLNPLGHVGTQFNQLFGLDRADAQSRKIAEAARVCREAVEEERDDTLAEELAAWRAARAENDGEDVQP